MNEPNLPPLGIDIGKSSFHAALLQGQQQRVKSAQFENQPKGFEQLFEWLDTHHIQQVHACLEATNIYGQALAIALIERGHCVSIVNPMRVKGYAKSQLTRTKNDQADAGLIARFCRDLRPSLWQPPPAELLKLRSLSRRLGALEQMSTQEKNRLDLCEEGDELKEDILAHLAFLKAQVKQLKKRLSAAIETHPEIAAQQQLLVSIPGIGEHTAAIVLAEIGPIELFTSARQLAAFAGLTPRESLSGTSVKGKTRLCKIGNPRLRKALYFPALAAIRYSLPMQQFRARLLANGKNKMQVVGAIMHKLIRIIYGVLTSEQPFNPDKLGAAFEVAA
jgi:transposase